MRAPTNSGQMSAHVRGLSTSSIFPEHTPERTVREFVNEILLGIFFWWMNHYLNDLPRMTEDPCGSKRKKRGSSLSKTACFILSLW